MDTYRQRSTNGALLGFQWFTRFDKFGYGQLHRLLYILCHQTTDNVFHTLPRAPLFADESIPQLDNLGPLQSSQPLASASVVRVAYDGLEENIRRDSMSPCCSCVHFSTNRETEESVYPSKEQDEQFASSGAMHLIFFLPGNCLERRYGLLRGLYGFWEPIDTI